jgi:hypothetical protein
LPADLSAAHAANERAPLGPLPKGKDASKATGKKEQAEDPVIPKRPRYTQAEKGKSAAPDPVKTSGTRKRKFERGETSGTAHEKPLPTSSRSRDDGSDASLRHFLPKPPSDEWNESMTLRDYIGHLKEKASSSGSSGSGSDVLAAAGFNMDQILAKNGRLAGMESRYFTPKMDPKFERTVSNSSGYRRDFDPDKYQPSKRPGDYWLQKDSPYKDLPPELKQSWEDNPTYMPKHKLEKRYEEMTSAHAQLVADKARLQGQVEELKADLKNAEQGKRRIGALGAMAGLAGLTLAGIVLGSDSGSDSESNPQPPPAT